MTGVRLAVNVTNYGGSQGIVNITVTNSTGNISICTTVDQYVISAPVVNHVVTSCNEALLGRYIQVEMIVASTCSKPKCEFSMSLYEVEVMLGKDRSPLPRACNFCIFVQRHFYK